MIDLDTIRQERTVDLGKYDEALEGATITFRELTYRERLTLFGATPKEGQNVVKVLDDNILGFQGLSAGGEPITSMEAMWDHMTIRFGKMLTQALLDESRLSEEDAGNS